MVNLYLWRQVNVNFPELEFKVHIKVDSGVPAPDACCHSSNTQQYQNGEKDPCT
jgi:hypothetical protein